MFAETRDFFPKYLYSKNASRITRTLLKWGRSNFCDYPWRKRGQSWQKLIAEVLLQRTRASNVIPIYEDILLKYQTIEQFANASEKEIESLVSSLGLRWRSKYLYRLGQELKILGGNVPDNFLDLVKLPGVGDYVANAYLTLHKSKYGTIIDVNIVRFICRITDQPMDGETRRKKWLISIAKELTPRWNNKKYNYAILDFSMKVCVKRPLCIKCPFYLTLCQSSIGGNHGS